jgi:hypothetical protein
VFQAEGARDLGIVLRETNLLPGFAARNIEGSLIKGVSFSAWECGLSCFLSGLSLVLA